VPSATSHGSLRHAEVMEAIGESVGIQHYNPAGHAQSFACSPFVPFLSAALTLSSSSPEHTVS
jgi:hypothetical protein